MYERKNNYEVAVINYPLMDPSIKPRNHFDYLDLDYSSVDPWEVPVYIHIPFCSSICKFCVYSRQVPDKNGDILNSYIEALKKEIKLYSSTPYIKSLRIGSVFLGGGTPTCLTADQISALLRALKENLPLENKEITMECNIFNAQEEKIQLMSELGVTRVSTGVQTFNEKYRKMMSMTTSSQEVYDWIKMVKKYPFTHLSLDLLFGFPGQTFSEWMADVKTGLSLPVDHFSIYKLAVFAYTQLYKELTKKMVPPLPGNEVLMRMFLEGDKTLRTNHYTLQSSQEYCRTGKNARFWEQTYDGFGDNLSFGAFSFGYLNGVNYQNHPNPKDYIDSVNRGEFPFHMISKKASFQQLMERTMALCFRRTFVSKSVFLDHYGKTIEQGFASVLDELISQGLVEEGEDTYRLTETGSYYQGNVSVKFMQSTFEGVSPFKKKMSIGMHIVPEAL